MTVYLVWGYLPNHGVKVLVNVYESLEDAHDCVRVNADLRPWVATCPVVPARRRSA